MRRKIVPTPQEVTEGPQSVSFQIADGNKRQDCVLKTKFPTKIEASKYLHTHWPKIERLARDAIITGDIKDGQVRLVML
jgi:hypothetical protein